MKLSLVPRGACAHCSSHSVRERRPQPAPSSPAPSTALHSEGASSLTSHHKEQGQARPRSQEGWGPHSPGGVGHPVSHTQQRPPAPGFSPPRTETYQAKTEDASGPKHHWNTKNESVTRTNLKSSTQQPTQHVCFISLPHPSPQHPCLPRPHRPALPGMMETVSFSQDTTLTYSCTEEGMRHLKTATFPRIDL